MLYLKLKTLLRYELEVHFKILCHLNFFILFLKDKHYINHILISIFLLLTELKSKTSMLLTDSHYTLFNKIKCLLAYNDYEIFVMLYYLYYSVHNFRAISVAPFHDVIHVTIDEDQNISHTMVSITTPFHGVVIITSVQGSSPSFFPSMIPVRSYHS